MKTKIILTSKLIFLSFLGSIYGFDIEYNHPKLDYTDFGINIYGMSSKDFMAKGFSGQIEIIKGNIDGISRNYTLGETGNINGTNKNDYFFGFNHYRTNKILGGKGDDFYDIQHTYTIIENIGEGTDTFYTQGNTSSSNKENVENIISAGPGGRIYGNMIDNLMISEGKGTEVGGGEGNDVIIANGNSSNFIGGNGIDTIIFSGNLNDYTFTTDQRGITIKHNTNGAKFSMGNDIEQLQFDNAFFGNQAGNNILYVGANSAFKKISDAIKLAGNGDIIEVESGVYTDDFAIIDKDIKIIGKNGRAHYYAKNNSFKGKANFITYGANVTFENIEFSNNHVSDKNGAGIRFEGGSLTIKNCYFHNNEVGILGGNWSGGIVNIENSEFGYNGHPTNTTHTLNLGKIKSLNITNSYFHNTKNGHNIRSLADYINITNSYFFDGNSNTSFNIEIAQALSGNIEGNTFIQTEFGENTHMILNSAKLSSNITNNNFINLSSKGETPIFNNANNYSTLINLNNNKIYNYKSFIKGNISNYNGTGNITIENINITLPNENNSIGNIKYNNTPNNPIISNIIEFKSKSKIEDFTGKNITVGKGKNYKTIKDAILNANFGDKIYVDEGIYESDYSTFGNKQIAIIGLGKGAELKKVATISNGKAILVSTNSNLYIENLIFSNSSVADKNGAGIRFEGGTLTIENCIFKNNENGILTISTDIGKGKIWINKSQFLYNGIGGVGLTHGIYIGEIDFFNVTNSTFKGTYVGHNIKSRARTNQIENNIIDDDGKNTSYEIDLPNGGDGIIKGNTIIQSKESQNRTIISYSAEKKPTNLGTLIIENNVIKSIGNNAIGIKNFGTNNVFIRNNKFDNVTTQTSGKVSTKDDLNYYDYFSRNNYLK